MNTIQKIHSVEGWNGQHGQMFTFQLTLNDGRTGSVNAKTNDRYTEGQTVWVVDETNGTHGFKWKLSTKDPAEAPNFNNGPLNGSQSNSKDKDKRITASWAIGQALNAVPALVDDMQALQKTALELIQVHSNICEQ